ncbi:MAG TPA: type I-U CRISPR-associated protein Cas8c [Myxococcota bacterium]|nr:type I-U CRISPR-associated protein Cas8c [Myxococcota bacterium]
MASSTIPVDLFNPGQVFACLGLAEATEVLLGGVSAGFRGDAAIVDFTLQAPGETNPVEAVLDFLASASLTSEAPGSADSSPLSSLSTEKWGVPTTLLAADTPFPYPCPDSPATLPAVLSRAGQRLVIDHWGDATRRDNVKFWAGAGGYPGVGLLRDAIELIRDRLGDAAADPFALQAVQSSSFRFDWRRDYVPLGVGFSLNNHSKLQPLGYPLVEILAAIGLSHARPRRPGPSKLHYDYAVPIADGLALPLLRAALGCAPLPIRLRTFHMMLDWPGQENQARCITHVTEEI